MDVNRKLEVGIDRQQHVEEGWIYFKNMREEDGQR
jgi:hypothetical protein